MRRFIAIGLLALVATVLTGCSYRYSLGTHGKGHGYGFGYGYDAKCDTGYSYGYGGGLGYGYGYRSKKHYYGGRRRHVHAYGASHRSKCFKH